MAKYICPACKTKNRASLKYCKKCGHWLQDTIFPALPAKPFYRSIPGFRSGKWWKVILSSVFYIFLLLFLFALAFGGNNDTNNKTKSKPAPTTNAVNSLNK